MSNTAFGVAQTTDGVGCKDSDMRHILGTQWDSVGVVKGLSVVGTTSLYYTVDSGVAVCSKGSSDGKTIAYFDGANTATVAANSAGNPRIDSVYIYSNDISQGDSDNLVHIGVVSGTASATPVAPTLPTYATLLSEMLLPAGATTTANATVLVSATVPNFYGMSRTQLDGPLVYQGTSVLRGIGANFVYLFPSISTSFPDVGPSPSLLVTNGDWDAENIRQMTGAVQGDTGIVFFESVLSSGSPVRINWTLVGRRA